MRPTATLLAIALAVLLLATPPAKAQQAGSNARIGLLRTAPPPGSYIEAFRQGLREHGHVEGRDIAFEYRWAGGNVNRLPELAAELVRLQVNVIVTDGTPPALAVRKASNTIPVVMASSGDPVGTGLIASLARPAGNITGLTSINAELDGKLLEVLREVVPKSTHVAILGPENSPLYEMFVKNTEALTRAVGLKLTALRFRGPDDYESRFRRALEERAQALIVRATPVTTTPQRDQIIALAARYRLPAIYDARDWTERGGLMSYGVDRVDMYRRAATYVHKILKGAKPADLPVEQPTKFELVINLKAAKALGLTFRQSLLLRTDQVIE